MEISMVAFEPMNEVHKKEIKVLDKLLEELEKNQDIAQTLEEFIKDVQEHFSFEEGLMQTYNFFAYIPHKMEHDRILNELYTLRNRKNEDINQYLNDNFIPWLNTHIETMDTVTAGFFDMVKAK